MARHIGDEVELTLCRKWRYFVEFDGRLFQKYFRFFFNFDFAASSDAPLVLLFKRYMFTYDRLFRY